VPRFALARRADFKKSLILTMKNENISKSGVDCEGFSKQISARSKEERDPAETKKLNFHFTCNYELFDISLFTSNNQ